MVLAQKRERLVHRRNALMVESLQALLSCRHSLYEAPFRQSRQIPAAYIDA